MAEGKDLSLKMTPLEIKIMLKASKHLITLVIDAITKKGILSGMKGKFMIIIGSTTFTSKYLERLII